MKKRPLGTISDARRDLTRRWMRAGVHVMGAITDTSGTALLRSTRGSEDESDLRGQLAFILKAACEMTDEEIAQAIGRDRTSIEHAIDLIKAKAEADDGYEATLDKMTAALRLLVDLQDALVPEIERRAA